MTHLCNCFARDEKTVGQNTSFLNVFCCFKVHHLHAQVNHFISHGQCLYHQKTDPSSPHVCLFLHTAISFTAPAQFLHQFQTLNSSTMLIPILSSLLTFGSEREKQLKRVLIQKRNAVPKSTKTSGSSTPPSFPFSHLERSLHLRGGSALEQAVSP